MYVFFVVTFFLSTKAYSIWCNFNQIFFPINAILKTKLSHSKRELNVFNWVIVLKKTNESQIDLRYP